MKILYTLLKRYPLQSLTGIILLIFISIITIGGIFSFVLSPLVIITNSLNGLMAGEPTELASEIPEELLVIYMKAQDKYKIPWTVLAAINKIETNFGRDLSVSSAGAVGWMQFMPSTWEEYKTDGDNDGKYNPYNPYDAIFTAANYLDANGYKYSPYNAIWRYNHADWYVRKVLKLASQYSNDYILSGEAKWPLPQKFTAISSPFGIREHPIFGDKRIHTGIDIPVPKGTPVFSISQGKVIFAGWNNVYGNSLRVQYDGYVAIYGHLSKLLVSKNDVVEEDQLIGTSGSSGWSTGPHLHFEIRINNKAVDPLKYLKKNKEGE